MGVTRFEQGAMVTLDSQSYKILRKIPDGTWQLENSRTKQIISHSLREVMCLIGDGKLTFPGTSMIVQCGPANANLTDGEYEIAKVRLAYVNHVLRLPDTQSEVKEAIAQVWAKIKTPPEPPSFSTVYRWKRRYKASGHDIRALVPNHSAKGNFAARYDSEVVELCQRAIQAKYLRRERGTVQSTLEDAILRVRDRNTTMPSSLALPLPTRRLVSRLVSQIPAFDKRVARYGHQSANMRFRSTKAHVGATAPLERAEIDHSIIDIYVVDERNRLPLGKPWITACIDDFSRCIIGFHLSFTSPSYHTVAKCLQNCFLPKERLKELYPDLKSDWQAHGVMSELVVDNGLEFHSTSLELLAGSVGMTLRYAPRKQGWFKGKIERFFGELNRGVAHVNPGTTFASILEKGDYDAAKHAVVTLSDMQRIVTMWIADVYHQKPHRRIGTSPARMWETSIAFEDIHRADDAIHLDAVIGRAYQRTLTHKGVEFEGLFYNSPELSGWRNSQEGSVDDTRQHLYQSKMKVEIRVDESNLGSIYVLNPQDPVPYMVPCLDAEYASGLSRFQHDIMKRWRKERGPDARDADGWMEAKRAIQEIVEDAMSLKRGRKSAKRLGRYLEDDSKASSSGSKSVLNTSSADKHEGFLDEVDLEQGHFSAIEQNLSEGLPPHQGTTRKPALQPIYRRDLSE